MPGVHLHRGKLCEVTGGKWPLQARRTSNVFLLFKLLGLWSFAMVALETHMPSSFFEDVALMEN